MHRVDRDDRSVIGKQYLRRQYHNYESRTFIDLR